MSVICAACRAARSIPASAVRLVDRWKTCLMSPTPVTEGRVARRPAGIPSKSPVRPRDGKARDVEVGGAVGEGVGGGVGEGVGGVKGFGTAPG